MGQKTSQRDTPEMLLEIWSKCSLFTHLSRSRRGIANGRCGASTVVAVNETNDRSGSTAVHPVSCGNRPQWVESGHSR